MVDSGFFSLQSRSRIMKDGKDSQTVRRPVLGEEDGDIPAVPEG